MQDVVIRDEPFVVADGHEDFWSRVREGRWEPATLDVIAACVGPGTAVVDLGAWIGPTVLYAARKGRSVLAFEPDPAAAAVLRENVALNPDVAERIEILERAVWTRAGAMTMASRGRPGDSMSSLVHRSGAVTWEVECMTPDEIAARLEPDAPLFVKVDIEGGEFAVVPALGPLLDRPRVDCLVSFHPGFVAGGHPRWHRTIPMTRRVFDAFPGFGTLHVGRRAVTAMPLVGLMRRLGAFAWETRESVLFSRPARPVAAFAPRGEGTRPAA